MEFYGEYVGFTFAVCKMFPRFDLQQRTVLLWFWGVKPEPFCTRGEGARTDLHPPLINTVELCTQTTYAAVCSGACLQHPQNLEKRAKGSRVRGSLG